MVDDAAQLRHGRESYAGQAWEQAHDSLSAADRSRPLAAQDLELLATAAYLLGRDAEYLGILERAHGAHLDAGERCAAVRCAFWIGVNLAQGGDLGRAGGWLGRARRLLDQEDGDRVERGYLLLPVAIQQRASGDWQAAAATAGEAAEIGERFGDADLFALATHEQGHVLTRAGRLQDGLGLLDEAMVGVLAGEPSPIVSGIVYCGVILACQHAYDVRRAQEWTIALTQWCERQPDLMAFTGRCLVHRAEIMQLGGSWSEALDEAERAGERCLQGANRAAAGEACYRRGEILRLRGQLGAAEEAYRESSRSGRDPQPGLALLRLAQGDIDAARAAIRRVTAEAAETIDRAGCLAACAEIMVATGDPDAARSACAELERIAALQVGGMLEAMATVARGAVDLADDDAVAALRSLRRAASLWHELQAPYEAARTQVLLGLTCRALGDEDGAAVELEGARATFARLGAAPDLDRLAALTSTPPSQRAHGLSERERHVLAHLATGTTNKQIAAELVLSVRTVDRHVSNIFAKLGVSSRAAATAFAHEHRLV